MSEAKDFAPICPAPLRDGERVSMAHGGGGRAARRLVDSMFRAAFSNPALDELTDAALLDAPPPGHRLAFSTDAHVVAPLFFPGGDLGSLAVFGTVNDLAMAGAEARFLSAAFVLEEGFEFATLRRIAASMAEAARAAGVAIVAGDTKVVDRGKGDGAYVAVSGVGFVPESRRVGPSEIREGDAIVVSGDVGRHGLAVMAAREELGFEPPIESDAAAVHRLVAKLFEAGVDVRCLRDPTRGGLAAILVELAEACGGRFALREESIPVRADVRAACELLGLDPLRSACEGRFAAFIGQADAERAVAILRSDPLGREAAIIGAVESVGEGAGFVKIGTALGSRRLLDLPEGDPLPRIC